MFWPVFVDALVQRAAPQQSTKRKLHCCADCKELMLQLLRLLFLPTMAALMNVLSTSHQLQVQQLLLKPLTMERCLVCRWLTAAAAPASTWG
jgi:putative effector of murein hydrolase LrgA (UPF0299 family)